MTREKNTKCNQQTSILNLEIRNKMKNSVHKLIVNNTAITDPEKFISEVRDYYASLFSRRLVHFEKDCFEYLAYSNCPFRTEVERGACES